MGHTGDFPNLEIHDRLDCIAGEMVKRKRRILKRVVKGQGDIQEEMMGLLGGGKGM